MVLRNFAVANLCFILPAVWLVSWFVPERLEINVNAPSGLSVNVGFYEEGKDGVEFVRAESIAGAEWTQTIKAYFVDPIDKERLALSFVEEKHPFELVSISILKHCFFRSTLAAVDFKSAFKLKDGVFVPEKGKSACWKTTMGSDRRLVAAVIVVEFLLLLACGLSLLIKTDCPRRKTLIDSVSVALLLAFFFCVAVPLQSYLVNRSMFGFSILAFAGEAACLFVITFLFLALSLYVSQHSFGRVMHLFLLCIVAYEYLETGVLAIGMPQLNGETWYFANKHRQFVDTLILIGIVGIPIVSYHWIKDHLHLVSACLLILCISSLFDIRSEKQTDTSNGLHQYFVSQMDVVKNAVYSPKRNVFVFILDSVTVDAASDVIRADSELRSKFPGFTAFCNNVGMGPFTDWGLPGIMTGKYQGDELTGGNYTYSIFTEKSFVAPYLKANAYVGFTNGLYEYGLCSHVRMPPKNGDIKKTKVKTPFMRRTNDLLGMNLWEIVRFRLTPFIVKKWYLAMVFKGMDSHTTIKEESTLYPLLQYAQVDASHSLTLHVYHTYGGHPPIYLDEQGKRVRLGSRETYEGFCGQTHFVLRQLAQLFDNYRMRGIYENSFILICADHGSVFAKPGKAINLTPRAIPMLWVKPEKDLDSFRESEAPTSHAKIAGLMEDVLHHVLPIDKIESILTQPRRVYREGGNSWIVEADGNVVQEVTGKPAVEK